MLQSTLRKWDSWPHEPIMGLVLVPSGPPVSEVQTEGSSFQGTPHSKSSGTFTESVRCSARRGGFHRRHHQSPAPWKFQARSRSPQLPSWVRTVGRRDQLLLPASPPELGVWVKRPRQRVFGVIIGRSTLGPTEVLQDSFTFDHPRQLGTPGLPGPDGPRHPPLVRMRKPHAAIRRFCDSSVAERGVLRPDSHHPTRHESLHTKADESLSPPCQSHMGRVPGFHPIHPSP